MSFKTLEEIENAYYTNSIELYGDIDKELQEELHAIDQIISELRKAKSKWPDWVFDPVHSAGILCEESGETMQAALDFCYSNGDIEKLRKEACQTGAMAIRILENLDKYKRIRTYINQDNEIKRY